MILSKHNIEKTLFLLGLILWISLILGSFCWNWIKIKDQVFSLVKKEALSLYRQDVSYRLWGARVGGVYVDATKIKPNPHLSFLKDRDVVTIDGKNLTLVNPAYMSRMVYKISEKNFGYTAHLTSLNPMNPMNRADDWEKSALVKLKNGKKEVVELVYEKGQPFFRIIRPFVTQKSCLKCHGQYGYRVGDIRGGLSIKIPFLSYSKLISSHQKFTALIHGAIGFIGIFILIFSYLSLRKNKKALMDSEERLRTLMDAMPDIVCFKDHKGRWLEANKSDLELFELSGVDYRGKTDRELSEFSPRFKEAFLTCEKTDELAWQKGLPLRNDEIIEKPDGEKRIYDVIKVPVFDERGGRKGLLVVGRDVTEKRETEKALKNLSELRDIILRLSVNFINAPLENIDNHIDESLKLVGEFLEVDRAYIFKVDYQKGFMTNISEWCAPGVKPRIDETQNLTIDPYLTWLEPHKKGEIVRIDSLDDVQDEKLKDILISQGIKSIVSIPIISSSGDIFGFVALECVNYQKNWKADYLSVLRVLAEVIANILSRKDMLKKLEESEEKLRRLVERLPVGLYQCTPGPKGKFILVNQTMVDMFGYDSPMELKKVNVADLYPDSNDRLRFSQMLIEKEIIKDYEMQLKKKNGELFWVSITATVIRDSNDDKKYFEGSIIDITERKKAEKEKERLQLQLQQAQKLESIGRLAGGIAHDINNLLMPILGYSELLWQKLSPDDPNLKAIRKINEAGEKARNIIKQLLAFSRKQVISMSPTDVNEMLEKFQGLIKRILREDIEFELFLKPSIATVNADKVQLEQVILNLVVNAQDAMPDGGKLTIETDQVILDERYAATHKGVTPGEYVLITVTDTGTGMDEETQRFIFDPFFTTKPKDIGTGLGLSTVYGIIKQHKGNIWVYSEVGKGTTFKIYLPVYGKEEIKESSEPIISDFSRKIRVLLVEDDRDVMDLISTILNEFNLDVVEITNPLEAIKIVREGGERFDLLLTDVIMPEMNGKELYERLKEIQKDIKVIYMSGYTENIISDKGILKPDINFISKPFSAAKLIDVIKKVIG